jgi:membrane-associated protein
MNFDAAHIRQLIEQLGPWAWAGHVIIWAIVFAESGLFFGFFLPGDSLLFTAGFLASQGVFNLPALALGCFVAAVLGDNVGYASGARFGRKLFQRDDSRFFKKKYLVSAEDFFKKHGKMALILARFTPIVRTFAPIVAGIGAMRYRTFLVYNVAGGLIWTFGLTLLGFYLGKLIPDVDKYLLPITLAVIVLSFVPSLIHIYQERKSHRP